MPEVKDSNNATFIKEEVRALMLEVKESGDPASRRVL